MLGAAVVGLVMPGVGSDRHVALGVFALLLGCLIQVVVFMYFAVTGKMLSQAVHLGKFDLQTLHAVNWTKRRSLRWLGLAVVVILLVAVTGAIRWRVGQPTQTHLVVVAFVVVAYLFIYYRQFLLIVQHSKDFEHIMNRFGDARLSKKTSSS